MDSKQLKKLVAGGTPVVTKRDFMKVKQTDAYYISRRGSSLLQSGKPAVLELLLPAGDYIIVGQTFLFNYNDSSKNFYCSLDYSNKTTDWVGGALGSTNNSRPYRVLLNFAVSVDSKKSVKFLAASNANAGFLAENMRITAVRLGSLTVFSV